MTPAYYVLTPILRAEVPVTKFASERQRDYAEAKRSAKLSTLSHKQEHLLRALGKWITKHGVDDHAEHLAMRLCYVQQTAKRLARWDDARTILDHDSDPVVDAREALAKWLGETTGWRTVLSPGHAGVADALAREDAEYRNIVSHREQEEAAFRAANPALFNEADDV